MANTTVISSPNILGKRSSLYDNDEEMNYGEDCKLPSSFNGHVGKKLKLASRFLPPPTTDPTFPATFVSTNDDSQHLSKMARRSDENSMNQSAVTFNPEVQELKYQNSQYATRMHQAEITLQKKEHEIRESRSLNQRLMEELQKRTTERDAIAEDNRILKKGIAIQENKLRELNQQMQAYEQFIIAAKAYIEEAEREKFLRQQQSVSSYPRSDFFPPQPPPDVF